MKCKKCGHRSNTISAMAKHYREKHKNSVKHKRKTGISQDSSVKSLLQKILKKLD